MSLQNCIQLLAPTARTVMNMRYFEDMKPGKSQRANRCRPSVSHPFQITHPFECRSTTANPYVLAMEDQNQIHDLIDKYGRKPPTSETEHRAVASKIREMQAFGN